LVIHSLEEYQAERKELDWVRTKVRNSSRVFGSSLKLPNMADVNVLLLIFCTPRITIHMCLLSKENC